MSDDTTHDTTTAEGLAAAAQDDVQQAVNELAGANADTNADASLEASAQALGDASAENADAAAADAAAADAAAPSVEDAAMDAYKTRLREFMRALKKLDGEWYIIQCYSGYENKVKTNLETRSRTLGVDQQIHEVVVPIEEVTEIKDGKRKRVKRKLLPGYVLVRIELDDASWSVIRDTPGVTSFVGNEGQPTPVKIREVAKFLLPPEAAKAEESTEDTDSATGGVDVERHRCRHGSDPGGRAGRGGLRGRRVRHRPLRSLRLGLGDHLRDRRHELEAQGPGLDLRP